MGQNCFWPTTGWKNVRWSLLYCSSMKVNAYGKALGDVRPQYAVFINHVFICIFIWYNLLGFLSFFCCASLPPYTFLCAVAICITIEKKYNAKHSTFNVGLLFWSFNLGDKVVNHEFSVELRHVGQLFLVTLDDVTDCVNVLLTFDLKELVDYERSLVCQRRVWIEFKKV